jgi:alkanesulfonate monooxygenase SsuD/methylene tetrahydromethanopterin reductase-like flavin-dependent oxidoreductase (luciferase family)
MRFVVRIHQRGWSYPELETVWRESERLGYDGASLYDVLGDSGPECWTALTALTAATQKLVAVPMLLANPYRHPAVVGKMAATLDALSRGRVIVGLGAGGSATDAAAFGVGWPPARERIAALGEAVEVMRILWRGGGSFRGRWYQLHDAPPVTRASPGRAARRFSSAGMARISCAPPHAMRTSAASALTCRLRAGRAWYRGWPAT